MTFLDRLYYEEKITVLSFAQPFFTRFMSRSGNWTAGHNCPCAFNHSVLISLVCYGALIYFRAVKCIVKLIASHWATTLTAVGISKCDVLEPHTHSKITRSQCLCKLPINIFCSLAIYYFIFRCINLFLSLSIYELIFLCMIIYFY